MSRVTLGDVPVGRGDAPFVIAEMSGNHNGSLEHALAIVDAAAEAGAQAIKIQTYTAATMTLDIDAAEFRITDPATPWSGVSLYSLYSQAFTPWEWHEAIFRRARERGLVVFSTPFDESAVDFLETLNAPCYKIASFENADIPLIRRVAATGKPVIISTGMATLAELDDAVRSAREGGAAAVILLKCTSSYPASPQDSHLRTIPHLRELFGCEVGLSDHTLGIGVPVAAVTLGATVVEKHLTLDRSAGGVDSAFSLEPHEMRQLVVECRRAWEALGTVCYGPTASEKPLLQFRRSLYITKDLAAGEQLTAENVRAIRPGLGLAPKHMQSILGRRVRRPVARGTALAWDLLD